MESIEISHLEVLLVGQSHNHFVDELNLFLTLVVFEIIILELVKNEKHSIECNVMDFV